MTVIVNAREAFFIRKDSLPIKVRKGLLEKYKFLFFEEKACAKCEFHEERLASPTHIVEGVCDNCAAFKGGAELASIVTVGDNSYLRTPIGDQSGLQKILTNNGIGFNVKERYPSKRFSQRIKFTGTLKDYQPEAVTAIIEKERGVLRAPPRSGKTIMAAAAICKIGRKTMIMASQREWLLGFKETFIGSKTQKALTDCSKDKIGIAKTYADFLKYDICLVTTQTFWSEGGQRLLRKLRDMFECLFVDEIHTGAAPKYAIVISSINSRYKIGLSGTPSRKDGRYVLMRNLMGALVADIKVERLKPHVRLVRTSYVKTYKGNVPWTRMISSLEKDPKRLKLIAQWAVKDALAGHMVLIPFSQITPIKALVMAINRIAGKELAFPFYGGLKKDVRDSYIQAARRYKAKILVCNTKMISTGTNIPRASCLYDVTMSSNLENCEQRTSRILTPWDDKPTPILRIFLDDSNVRRNCLRNEIFNCLKPKFRPVISDRDNEVLKGYFANKQKFNQRLEF
jgi:superfamily II DNA or RNA helicase